VADSDTPSVVQAMRKALACQGAWQTLSQDATGSRGQVQSMQRNGPKDEFKTRAATDQHDFHPYRSEVCWQIRRQAKRRNYCDNGQS